MRFLARFAPAAASGSSWNALARLLRGNARAYAALYLGAGLALAVQAGTTGFSAWLLRDIINQVFVERSLIHLYGFAALIIAAYAVKGAAAYVSSMFLSRAGNAVVARLQTRLFETLTRQDAGFFARYSLGELVTRVTGNAQAARSLIDTLILGIGRDLTTVLALIAVMLMQNWLLSLVAAIAAPLALVGLRLLKHRIKALSRQEIAMSGRLVTAVSEAVHGVRVVKAYGLEQRLQSEIDAIVAGVEARANDINRLGAATSPLMETFGGVAIALVVAFGGFQVIHLGQDAGSFFSFITALLLAYEPAKRLASLNVTLGRGLTGLDLMYGILDSRPAIADAADARDFQAAAVEVRLEDVHFAYRADVPVLDGVSLVAQPGTVTALVGPSGGGKSTLFALIERFYDVDAGAVTLNGIDIRQLKLADLRGHIAYVTQDTVLFEGSIASNIADGRPGASRAEIIAAARDANAYDFIMALPEGFDTPVSGGGTSLSGGQRQRLSIARALLRAAPVLLLDEATAALDTQSEAEVQDALARLMVGRTTLVIAHRLSTIRTADCICVLEKGRIVQSGTHAALLAEGGLYAHLNALQFRDKDAAANGIGEGAR